MAPTVWAAMPALGGGGGMLPSAVGPRGGGGPGAGFARAPAGGGAPNPGVRGGPGGQFGAGGAGRGAADVSGSAPATGGPAAAAGPGGAGGPGAPGGFVRGGPAGGASEQQLIDYLEANQGSAEFLVATSNSNSAAPIVLATGKPVMSLGGFLGSDPILSAQSFASLVQAGAVRFVIGGGRGFGGFGGGNNSVMSWVQQNCAQIEGGQLYDCAPAA
jgi:hypothetical protein